MMNVNLKLQNPWVETMIKEINPAIHKWHLSYINAGTVIKTRSPTKTTTKESFVSHSDISHTNSFKHFLKHSKSV